MILTHSICKKGGRDYNQDFVVQSVSDIGACLVVCDGLGSYFGSEVASRLCGKKIIDSYERLLKVDASRAANTEFVSSYILAAHNFVVDYKEKNQKIKSSCTTVACVVTDLKNTTFAHIGDTRIYYFKNNILSFQSRDHSLSQVAVDLGQIALKDVRSHKDQNKLTRVLGNDYYIEPDCYSLDTPLKQGDSLLVCSDGFWEYVYEEEMEKDLLTSTSPKEALEKMEARLSARVGKQNDNYSAILATIY